MNLQEASRLVAGVVRGVEEFRRLELSQRVALVEEAFAVLCAASPGGAVEVDSDAYLALQMVRAEEEDLLKEEEIVRRGAVLPDWEGNVRGVDFLLACGHTQDVWWRDGDPAPRAAVCVKCLAARARAVRSRA